MDRTTFLNQLYQFSEGKLELRALPSRKQAFFDFEDISAINVFCSDNQDDNLYFGVATRDGQGGTKGNIVHIPCVWADIDFKDTPRKIIADRLDKFPYQPSVIIRSGGGIHLYWFLKEPAEKEDIPQVEDVNRRIAHELGGDLNACDAARVLRMPGTVNHKYPAPCEIAQHNDVYVELNDFLSILPEVPDQKEELTPDKSNNWLSEAMKGVSSGQRNATATKIAGYWINKLSPGDVLTIMAGWNQRNSPPLSEQDLRTVVKSVSRYDQGVDQKKIDMSNVYDAKRMLEEYRKYISTLKQNRFITGIREIDKRIRGVAGGEVLTIMARAGSFKTATLQNLLKGYVNNSSWAAVFFSLEMPIPSVTERYHEIIQGTTGRDIEEFYTSEKDGVHKIQQGLETAFLKELKNLFIVPVRVSISDIGAYVRLIEREYSVKVGVIGIDYLGLLDGPGTGEYEIISRLSKDIKNMTKMLNLPAIVLSQVSRKGGGGQTPISLDMGRGSGAIEEGADFVLGLWQAERRKGAFEDPEPEYDLICRILKNRKGSINTSWKLDLDPETLRIGPDAEKWEPPKANKERF